MNGTKQNAIALAMTVDEPCGQSGIQSADQMMNGQAQQSSQVRRARFE